MILVIRCFKFIHPKNINSIILNKTSTTIESVLFLYRFFSFSNISRLCPSFFFFFSSFLHTNEEKKRRKKHVDWLQRLYRCEEKSFSRSFFFLWYPLSDLMDHFLSENFACISFDCDQYFISIEKRERENNDYLFI
jgi:hypothetical protein